MTRRRRSRRRNTKSPNGNTGATGVVAPVDERERSTWPVTVVALDEPVKDPLEMLLVQNH